MKSEIDHQRLALNDPSELQIQVESVGDRNYPLLIVDHLYRDPEYVRETALALDLIAPTTSHPGEIGRLKTDISALHTLVWEHVARQFGYTRQDTIDRSNFPGMIFTRIHRKKKDLTIAQCRPHADPLRAAGVVYLNLPDQCRGGTSFFRHRATGVEEAVLPKQITDSIDQTFMKHAQQQGVFDSYKRYCTEMFDIPYLQFIRLVMTTLPRERDYLIESNADWELTRTVEMKFNRLICYPGFLIHSGHYRDDWFGEQPDEQRLTQNLFVN